MVAAELELPYACIPAGTRNHFALDLGVDRDDVVGALDAFVTVASGASISPRSMDACSSTTCRWVCTRRRCSSPATGTRSCTRCSTRFRTCSGPDADAPNLRWRGPGGRGVGGRHPRLEQRVSARPRTRLGDSAATRPGESSGSRCWSRSPPQRTATSPTGSRCSSGPRPSSRSTPPTRRGRDRRRVAAARPAAAVPDPTGCVAREHRSAAPGRVALRARARPAARHDRRAGEVRARPRSRRFPDARSGYVTAVSASSSAR